MSLIEVRNVWKRYADKTVLENVRLRVEKNEFVTIVGASGCGKTTFLRMLLGEVEPCEGTIRMDGAPLVAEPRADRGVVFQRYSVFPHLTVLGNVLLGLDLGVARLFGRTFGRRRAQNVAPRPRDAGARRSPAFGGQLPFGALRGHAATPGAGADADHRAPDPAARRTLRGTRPPASARTCTASCASCTGSWISRSS